MNLEDIIKESMIEASNTEEKGHLDTEIRAIDDAAEVMLGNISDNNLEYSELEADQIRLNRLKAEKLRAMNMKSELERIFYDSGVEFRDKAGFLRNDLESDLREPEAVIARERLQRPSSGRSISCDLLTETEEVATSRRVSAIDSCRKNLANLAALRPNFREHRKKPQKHDRARQNKFQEILESKVEASNQILAFFNNDDSHISQSKLTDNYVRDLMKINNQPKPSQQVAKPRTAKRPVRTKSGG